VARLLLVAGVSLCLAAAAAAATAPREPKDRPVPALQAKARAINLRLADLPQGNWSPKTQSSSNRSSPRCSYYNPDQSDLTRNADVDSPEFTLPSGSFTSSSTTILENDRQGRAAYARVVQPALPRCLGEVFRAGTGDPDNVVIVSSAHQPFPRLADRTDAYRIVADFTGSGTPTRVFIDLVLLNRGRIDVTLFFAGIGDAISKADQRAAATAVAGRMAKAAAAIARG
jgi:hypothetical protein